ncbi:MAG: hypothetical protein HY22_03995 [[Candidatus Thermochlorobacteriaceae] bacterium GBChlB]|nr:MAG: hypothetical protein HY22_03995 [[Candidatus Thermochlorobacteriaceae] bacterium GBChlB]
MKRIAVFIVIAAALQSCSVGTSFRETVTDNGIVLRVTGSTGVFFGIVSQNTAVRYEPSNLASEFQVDSLQVRFTGEASGNSATNQSPLGPQGWGLQITLTDIRIRTDANR